MDVLTLLSNANSSFPRAAFKLSLVTIALVVVGLLYPVNVLILLDG
nr:MAG TPA: hypothetical protein [Bacteriophage sp.]